MNDGKFGQFFTGGDSGATDAGWVVSVGFGDPLDEPDDAQAIEIPGELSA